jgi:hypothetical protein
MTTYSDDDGMSEGERALARAYALRQPDDRATPEPEPLPPPVGMPLITMYRPTEPEQPPTRADRRDGRRDLAWVTLQIDEKVAAAVPREVKREVAAAMRRERDRMAEAIGKRLAAERKQFRTIIDGLLARIAVLEQRADGVVLDMADERRRRSVQ